MNVYVETNFVLELALLQEQHESCERILELCESGQVQLVIPAYALAEPNETLIRRDHKRKRLWRELNEEFTQLRRSTTYSALAETFTSVLGLLALTGDQHRQRFAEVRERLLHIAEVIPLDHDIIFSAAAYESQFERPQDALIFASVLQHASSNSVAACFLTRDKGDFKKPNLVNTLAHHRCKIMFSFSDGYRYIQSQL